MSSRAAASSSGMVADPLGDLHQHVQHVVPVMAEVEQALGGLPQLRRVALPQPGGDLLVPGQVLLGRAVAPPTWSISSRIRRSASSAGLSRSRSMPPCVPCRNGNANARRASADRSPSGSSRSTQRAVQAEGGRIPVGLGERPMASQTASSVAFSPSRAGRCAARGEAHPRRQHVRHGLLLGRAEHHLARQPVQQERLALGRADPQRPAEVLVAAVVDDVVGAPRGGRRVGQVLGRVGGEELGGQHGPPLAAVRGLDVQRRRALAARRQRLHPRPGEGVVGAVAVADGRRVLRLLWWPSWPTPAAPWPAAARSPRTAASGCPSLRPGLLQQLVDLGGDPGVARHAAHVVVDDHDQRVAVLGSPSPFQR